MFCFKISLMNLLDYNEAFVNIIPTTNKVMKEIQKYPSILKLYSAPLSFIS